MSNLWKKKNQSFFFLLLAYMQLSICPISFIESACLIISTTNSSYHWMGTQLQCVYAPHIWNQQSTSTSSLLRCWSISIVNGTSLPIQHSSQGILPLLDSACKLWLHNPLHFYLSLIISYLSLNLTQTVTIIFPLMQVDSSIRTY